MKQVLYISDGSLWLRLLFTRSQLLDSVVNCRPLGLNISTSIGKPTRVIVCFPGQIALFCEPNLSALRQAYAMSRQIATAVVTTTQRLRSTKRYSWPAHHISLGFGISQPVQ